MERSAGGLQVGQAQNTKVLVHSNEGGTQRWSKDGYTSCCNEYVNDGV